MYRRAERVRFSEVGQDGRLTLPGLINYFQDCSTFHSEDVGVGLDYLKENGCAWLMSFWQVIIEEYPKLGEEIQVETRPYGFEHFMGKRNFEMFSSHGDSLAKADSLWFYYNAKKGRPDRPPEDMISAYGLDEAIEMDYAKSRKIPLVDGMESLTPFPVRRIQLDTNDHVNNGQYVQMAVEYIPAGQVREFRIEYKKAARLGDVIYPWVGEEDGWTVVALCDENKKPYAVASARGDF